MIQTVEQFEQTLEAEAPPQELSVYLQSLWYDAKGNWSKAHQLVDSLTGSTAAAVHAYLHRVEGDNWNANYWYSRAGRRMPKQSVKEEWLALAKELLAMQ